MNKEFVKKIIQIKRLEYEAIKEVLPKGVKDKVLKLEYEGIEILKEIALEIFVDEKKENSKDIDRKVKKVKIS